MCTYREIADDAEADLAEALPALERAMIEVDRLDAASITEVSELQKRAISMIET